ncbi:MAG TPA: cytochrome b/b6 domain-containing protein [Peptococcaceae bacterium]|nr:cytochrome b/b6 domain-containing protein [Peptococcaceae bacterium]
MRLLHWSYTPAMFASLFSGLYINKPRRFLGFRSMNSARKTHFISQFVLLFSFLARVIYGLQNKNYREILPNRKTWKNLPKFLKYELFLTHKNPKFPKYNPGQKILFSGLAVFTLLQVITGLGLYASSSWQKLTKLAGGLNPLRQLHYLLALVLSTLVSGHLYFVFTHEPKKLKSIFTGYE